MTSPETRRGKAALLAVAGGLSFWLANFGISLTPIAADYRAGLGISYVPMLVEALVGGLILGFAVGYGLLRFSDRIPGRSPMQKSLLLGALALLVVTVFVELPSKYVAATDDATRYFLIALLFNAVRILALALVIGYLYPRLDVAESG